MTFRLLVAVFCATPLASQNLSVPSDTLLAGITARGRLLAAYDQAAWHGTDAVLAAIPESTLIRVGNTMLATQLADGRWTVLIWPSDGQGGHFVRGLRSATHRSSR
jgi:hypothetical protein